MRKFWVSCAWADFESWPSGSMRALSAAAAAAELASVLIWACCRCELGEGEGEDEPIEDWA